MHGDHQEQYLEAMKIEISYLLTWVFKLKILPDVTPSKLKPRFCVREDKQKFGSGIL
jgi:hypothetical protein